MNEHISSQFFASVNKTIAALRLTGQDIIRLDIGSPDMPPPKAVIDTLARSAADPSHHGYQPHNSTGKLRSAWAEFYLQRYNVELDPNHEILPLIGSKEGIFHLLQAALEPGDTVIIPDPGYLTYGQGAKFANAKPYALRLRPESDYLPDFAAIPAEVARQAKMMWLNYPNNPTGATATLTNLEQAVAFAREHDLLLCHDAAYSQVTYDGYEAPSVLQVPGSIDRAIEFNSLSKSHNMAGWRTGVAVGQQKALRALYAIKTNTDNGHFRPILDAAVQALKTDPAWILERNAIYQKRRDLVVDAFKAIEVKIHKPKGAIYIWFPVPSKMSGETFVGSLLEQYQVSLTPGTVFGPSDEGYVRLSYTIQEERLSEAMQRITKFYRSI
jgi:LL-diaminopimelate aminotransferase